MPAASANRTAKRQRTLPQMMGQMMNPMMGGMMNPMMGGMMNPMMGGGMAPMMMGGCNGMMGGCNGMMNPTMRRMMNQAAMEEMAGEDEEDMFDEDVGAVQDGPPPQPAAAASAAVVAQPAAPAHPVAPAAVPSAPVEHQPPPVIPYNKNDDAAITRSASIPMTRLSFAIEKLVPALDAGYTSVTSYEDLGQRFKRAHDRIREAVEGFPENIVQELPLVLGDAEVNEVAVQQGWKDEFLKPACGKAAGPPPTVAEFFAVRHDDSPICVICQQLLDGEVKTLGCGHAFHQGCMESWYAATSNFEERCPLRCQLPRDGRGDRVRGDDFEVVDFM
eukprot:Skav215246  [mRNA]  locus=scaffold811:185811:187769:- [translate_table: standard]